MPVPIPQRQGLYLGVARWIRYAAHGTPRVWPEGSYGRHLRHFVPGEAFEIRHSKLRGGDE